MNRDFSRRHITPITSICLFAWLSVWCLAACTAEDPSLNNTAEPEPDVWERRPQEGGSEDVGSVPDVGSKPSHGVLRIATFNVRRFFDPVCDSGRCGGQNWEDHPTQTEFEQRAVELAEAISRLRADVVMLQEVETALALKGLTEALRGLQGEQPPFQTAVLGETGDSASLDVAILARGELLSTATYREAMPFMLPNGQLSQFEREFLEVQIEHKGRRIIAFAAHFLSQRSESVNALQRRDAEARTAALIMSEVAQEHPEAFVVLGGDLNDTSDSSIVNAFRRKSLFSATDGLAPELFWTYRFEGSEVAIDHIVYAGRPWLQRTSAPAYAVRDAGRTGLGGSDHASLVAEFDW